MFSLVEEVYPVPGGQQGVGPTPDELVSKLRALSPIPIRFFDTMGRTSAFPQWRAVVSGTLTQLFDPADKFDRSVNSAGDGTVGVFVQGDNAGVTVGHTAVVSGRRDSGVIWRPVTSIAHEWFHLLGFPHASPACGSGGEAWPWPDGRMGGVGLDTTGSAPYRVIPDTDATPGYDLMSYCGIQAYDAPHWISPLNWTRAVESSPLRSLASAAAAGDDLLEVSAQASAGTVAITHVGPAPDTVPEGLARSPYSLVARNAAGAVVATVPLDRRSSSESGGPDYLIGRVARAGVTAVQIVGAGGQVLATRSQSAAIPTAKLLSPGRGARVGKGATVPVRVQVAGTVTDVEIDASSDGGRRYRTVYSGVDPGTRAVALPSSLFQASRRARLRVRVSDGFRESATVSKPFVVVARRPQVKILEPTGRLRTDAGGTVLLAGGAVDDQGRAIAGKSLVWRAGRRVIGRGAQVSAAIPAGVRSIRLTATDRHGRTGSDSIGARVRTTAPLFVKLSAKRVSRGARRATVLVSASQPATLRAGGRRFHVAPRARRVRVPIRAGRKPVRLRMVLSAGGRRSVNTLVIRRR